MARSTVIIATTDIPMAFALRARLEGSCLKLGLKLEVCPAGSKTDPGAEPPFCQHAHPYAEPITAYESSQELFDHLESRDPTSLADSLVVLDVGTDLGHAFNPAAPSNQNRGWYRSKARTPGIGVELMLRFPHVFPVFLSPSVPVGDFPDEDLENTNGHSYLSPLFKQASKNDQEWKTFEDLKKVLRTKNKQDNGRADDNFDLNELNAFSSPLLFVSPLDEGRGLCSTLERFARGMRCWFDPTGLRTLVRNRYLGEVFGEKGKWAVVKAREVLNSRVCNVAIAIDEERRFCHFNAYAAWKYGRRAWVVTTFEEFDKDPLWVASNTCGAANDVVLLRDIDMRFPDVPDKLTVRENIKDIKKAPWKERTETEDYSLEGRSVEKIGEKWKVYAVSSEANIVSPKEKWPNEKSNQKDEERLGQRQHENKIQYRGFSKPLGTIYDLSEYLCTIEAHSHDEDADAVHRKPQDDNKNQSVIAKLLKKTSSTKPNGEDSSSKPESSDSGHGAPYSNLMIAESLIGQSARCEGSPDSYLLGALLASEAYEILLGMSKTTALEALLAMHKAEVRAEVIFPGMSQYLQIEERKNDIESSAASIFSGNAANDARNMFLSRFWAELRPIYRDGEQFEAAEEANVGSFIHAKWPLVPAKPKWLSKLLLKGIDLGQWEQNLKHWFKRRILKVATSIKNWVLCAFMFSILITTPYLAVTDMSFYETWSHVLFSSLGLSLDDALYEIVTGGKYYLLGAVHIGLSYILFGLFISMLYRKLTRA